MINSFSPTQQRTKRSGSMATPVNSAHATESTSLLLPIRIHEWKKKLLVEETRQRNELYDQRDFPPFSLPLLPPFAFFPSFSFPSYHSITATITTPLNVPPVFLSFLILFRTGVTVISKRETIDWFTLESLVALLKKRQFYLFSDKKKKYIYF